METFNGELSDGGLEFCRIDYFRNIVGGKAFFLSHFHTVAITVTTLISSKVGVISLLSGIGLILILIQFMLITDHMQGLFDTEFHKVFKEPNGIYFYCSAITKQFIVRHPDIDIPGERIYVLEKECVYISRGDVCVKVTPMRAGHCPGSLMFLFESYNGFYLFTGDFRISLSDLKKTKALHEDGKVIKLQNLYLDTSFANPLYPKFLDRETSFNIIKDIILKSQRIYNIGYTALLSPAAIGQEYLMVELAKYFKTPIHVSDYAYERYHGLIEPLESIITTEVDSSSIHFCAFKQVNCNPCPIKEKTCKVLKIKPTALYFDSTTSELHDHYIQEDHLSYRVAYSSHCSLNELKEFVSYLKPEKISPLVVSQYSSNMMFQKLGGVNIASVEL